MSQDGVTSGPAGLVDSGYAWYRMMVAMLFGTVGSVGMWGVVVILPAVQEEFEADRGGASLAYTTTMIGFALGNVLVGRAVDRHGVARPALVAALTLGLGLALAALSTSLWQFALVQGVLIGVATSAGFGPMIADISMWFRRRRGIAVAAVASGNYIAGAVWPPIISMLLPGEGWRMTYIYIAVACVVILVPLAWQLRRTLPAAVAEGDAEGLPDQTQLASAGISPRGLQVMLIVAGLGCCVAMSMPQVHIVAYCADLGYGVARGAEMLSVMLAAGIISRLASGILADYIGGVRTLLLGSILQCLALFLYIPFDGLASLYVVSLIFGLSQGGIVPSYAIIIREYLPVRDAGQRIGLVLMSTIVGMALGGWLSGLIFDWTGSYEAAFLNGIAWNFLNIAIMVALLWRTRTPSAVPA